MQLKLWMKKGKRLFKIYVLGNLLLEQDALPIQLLPKLREQFSDIEFLELDPTENLPEEENLILIDTIINTDKIQILKDIDKIQSSPSYSLHDFDLGFQLKLAKKLNKLQDVTIIGIPPNISHDKVLEDLKEIIPNSLSKNE